MKKLSFILGLFCLVLVSCKKNDQPPVTPGGTDSVVYNLPDGAGDGVVYTANGTSAIVTLYAPYKNSVYLLGDFNNWTPSADYKMHLAPDKATWWVEINNLDPNTEYAYQFLVDSSLHIADPYCRKILDPDNDKYISADIYPGLKSYPTGKTKGIVSCMQYNTSTYTWQNTGFSRPDPDNLVVYELLIRDFTSDHSYAAALAKLDYLKNMGINAIELMPVNEFEGNSSWGYNPSFYFAPDKYYGTENALKGFIDACHGKGIAVIQDMVFNHSFGQSPMVQLYYDSTTGKPTAQNPWYDVNPTHPDNVGYQFNHESALTKAFFKKAVKFWMTEYHIDGFRFDLSKGFTQNVTTDEDAWSKYDASRIAIWDDYSSYIKSIDPNFYVILEHFAEATEEHALASKGMIMWNNLNYNFNEATMGWLDNSNFYWAFYDAHGFSGPGNLMTYMESHDEERITFKNITYGNANTAIGYSVQDLATALKRDEEGAAFLFAVPGPKMLWQFGELGYDYSIDYNDRTGEKPVRWDYFEDTRRKALYDAYSRFIHLKENNAIFSTTSFSYNLSGAGLAPGIKFIKLMNATDTVFVVGNFDVAPQNVDLDFGGTGTWYDAADNNAAVNIANGHYAVALAPGEYHIISRNKLN